jgi:hypothetical protein
VRQKKKKDPAHPNGHRQTQTDTDRLKEHTSGCICLSASVCLCLCPGMCRVFVLLGTACEKVAQSHTTPAKGTHTHTHTNTHTHTRNRCRDTPLQAPALGLRRGEEGGRDSQGQHRRVFLALNFLALTTCRGEGKKDKQNQQCRPRCWLGRTKRKKKTDSAALTAPAADGNVWRPCWVPARAHTHTHTGLGRHPKPEGELDCRTRTHASMHERSHARTHARAHTRNTTRLSLDAFARICVGVRVEREPRDAADVRRAVIQHLTHLAQQLEHGALTRDQLQALTEACRPHPLPS